MSIATEEATYSTDEVCAMVGITYRMLDYWLRRGYVQISDPSPGSGHARRFTYAEVTRLGQLVAQYKAAHAVLRDLSTGALWMKGTMNERDTESAHRRRHPSAGHGRRVRPRVLDGGGDAA